MSLSNEQRAGLGAWQTDKNRQTPYFRTYSRRALIDLPKLCMVIEDVGQKWTKKRILRRLTFPLTLDGGPHGAEVFGTFYAYCARTNTQEFSKTGLNYCDNWKYEQVS